MGGGGALLRCVPDRLGDEAVEIEDAAVDYGPDGTDEDAESPGCIIVLRQETGGCVVRQVKAFIEGNRYYLDIDAEQEFDLMEFFILSHVGSSPAGTLRELLSHGGIHANLRTLQQEGAGAKSWRRKLRLASPQIPRTSW